MLGWAAIRPREIASDSANKGQAKQDSPGLETNVQRVDATLTRAGRWGRPLGAAALFVAASASFSVVSYRIASGAQVLVVRGAARNLGAQPARGLSAVALAMNGDTVVARASAPVGVLLDPDVLASLESPSQVSGAYAQRSAGAHDVEIDPGGELPFMVVFPEMPEGAQDRVFLVEFVPFDP